MKKSTNYQIIAYPLDAVVSTPKLFYDLNQHVDYSICWTFDVQKSMLFESFDIANKCASELRILCPELLIMVQKNDLATISESLEQLLFNIKIHLLN